MKLRLLLLLPTLGLPACSSPAAPAPTEAVCTPLVGAADSVLIGQTPLWTLDSAPSLSTEQQRLLTNIRNSPATAAPRA